MLCRAGASRCQYCNIITQLCNYCNSWVNMHHCCITAIKMCQHIQDDCPAGASKMTQAELANPMRTQTSQSLCDHHALKDKTASASAILLQKSLCDLTSTNLSESVDIVTL